MTAVDAGSTALRAYRSLGPRLRMHVRWRWITCPFTELETMVPRRGRILDVGCGHALFPILLALNSPDRRIWGIDVDADKVRVATAAVRTAGVADRVQIRHHQADDRELPTVDGGWDAVVCTDVLYLLGTDRAIELVETMAAGLRPGGVMVLKEMDDQPAGKALVNRIQESLAVRVLRITAGDHVEVVALDRLVAALRSSGCSVGTVDLSHGYPHPHVAVLACTPHRPAAEPDRT